MISFFVGETGQEKNTTLHESDERRRRLRVFILLGTFVVRSTSRAWRERERKFFEYRKAITLFIRCYGIYMESCNRRYPGSSPGWCLIEYNGGFLEDPGPWFGLPWAVGGHVQRETARERDGGVLRTESVFCFCQKWKFWENFWRGGSEEECMFWFRRAVHMCSRV